MRGGRAAPALLMLAASLAGSWTALAQAPVKPVAPAAPAAPTFTLPPPVAPPLTRPDDPSSPVGDAAFAAFQRGYFVTALRESMKRLDANSNDAPAMTLIAELYRVGLGVRRDFAEAARWYKLASDRDDPNASFALGRAYLTGEGVTRDEKAARALFEKAAARNHAGALYNLGVMELDSPVANFQRAADFFRRASEVGDSDATYALAMLYREGTGVPQDRQKAAQLLKAAADERNIAAEVEFGVALFNGDGIVKDEAAAAKYFLRAAARENPIAQNRLARMLSAGRGVQRNLVEAMKWHILARASGLGDEYLDGVLATLPSQQRIAVEEAVRKFVGN